MRGIHGTDATPLQGFLGWRSSILPGRCPSPRYSALSILQNLTALRNGDSLEILQTRTRGDYHSKRFCHQKVKAVFEQFRNQPTFGVASLREGAFYRIEKSARRLAFFLAQLMQTDKLLLDVYADSGYAQYVDSIPVIGQQLKAQTLAFIGDPREYDDSACLVSLAGLDPAEHKSSRFEGGKYLFTESRPLPQR